MNIKTALQWGCATLTAFSDSAHLDTMMLLRYVTQLSHTELITKPDYLLSSQAETQFKALVQRRQQQEPIPYLIGSCEFWSLTLTVTPDCLIPRPDTELLVEKILEHYPKNEPIQLLDLGTGSGAIAIALASERPAWHITAIDQSEKALTIAQSNAQACNTPSIDFRLGNWFQPVMSNETFDGIVSNPPYLSCDDPHLLSSLRYEPHSALIAQENGYADLYYLIREARHYLKPRGNVWLEHGYTQAPAVKANLIKQGYIDVKQYQDLAGIMRVSRGHYAKSIAKPS